MIETLFPDLSRADARRVTRQMRLTTMRNAMLLRAMHYFGLRSVRLLLMPDHSIAKVQPPVIFGTFHIGVPHALGVAMERLPHEALVLRRRASARAQRKNVRVVETGETDEQRALAFHRAASHLLGGGVALMALDPEHAARIAAPFFGRTILLARGAFALARVARVPIVPLVARWRGLRLETVCGAPIAAASEQEMADAAAKWLEAYLRDQPGQTSARVLELLR
ncbi:MAG TPA: hypothetical protein VE010_21230 [Thermoanaerobaculia bacterium]|nr:hypothetical protein [Thermoanaerobaculia bacterium]